MAFCSVLFNGLVNYASTIPVTVIFSYQEHHGTVHNALTTLQGTLTDKVGFGKVVGSETTDLYIRLSDYPFHLNAILLGLGSGQCVFYESLSAGSTTTMPAGYTEISF